MAIVNIRDTGRNSAKTSDVRELATKVQKPSDTEAITAANTIINIVNIWPSSESIPIKRLKATKFKPDAFNINSTPINIATAFLRVMTPNTPNENRIELIARYEYKLSISNPS